MSDYTPPPGAERFAVQVHRQRAESMRQRHRLEGMPTEEVRRVMRDRQESSIARGNALGVLLERGDPEIPDILLDLLDDPDQDLWQAAARCHRTADPRILVRLRDHLDGPHQPAAACALARCHDATILPRVLEWFHGGDVPHRNLTVECLALYGDDEARRHLGGDFERGGRDEDDRMVLAIALVRSGDTRGVAYLEGVAREGAGSRAAAAAIWLRCHDPALGLSLMGRILDRGDLEARRSIVMHLSSLLPHAFTADGIHDARAWVEREQEALARDGGQDRRRSMIRPAAAL